MKSHVGAPGFLPTATAAESPLLLDWGTLDRGGADQNRSSAFARCRSARPSAAVLSSNCKRSQTEVERYIKAADQRVLSEAAIAKLSRDQT
jgi:hypothetical protein